VKSYSFSGLSKKLSFKIEVELPRAETAGCLVLRNLPRKVVS
jgi:hypothetical protein